MARFPLLANSSSEMQMGLLDHHTVRRAQMGPPQGVFGDAFFVDAKADSLVGHWDYGTGKYEIKNIHGKFVYWEGSVQGELVADGGWMVATLAKQDGEVAGVVRLRTQAGTIVSNFQRPGENWGVDLMARASKAAFLPLEINGVRVLVARQRNVWLVTNDHLKATTAGLSVRKSKNLDDTFEEDWLASWNDLVDGVYEGDGWVRCDHRARTMNKWGVENPVGHDLQFKYEPASVGAGCVKNVQTNARVCGATMTGGGANWPVPDARDFPHVLNMVSKNQRDYSKYLEKTLDVAFDETAKVAAGLKASTTKLDLVAKGVEGEGFQQLTQRCEKLGAEVSLLEGEKEELHQTIKCLKNEANWMQGALDAQKARLQQAEDEGFVLQSDLKAIQEDVQKLTKGAEKHDEELKKKCECIVQ